MGMKKSTLLLLACVALLVGCGTAATTNKSSSGNSAPLSAGTPQNGGTMTVTWSANPQTIDPRKIYNGEDWNIGRALYEGLYTDDSNFQLQPPVASGPPVVSQNGTVYTIHLRKGIKWSNGKPVTAQDFVYALRTELAPSFQSPDSYYWYMIKGAAQYEAGKSTHLGIKALNDYTLQYTLSQAFTAFPYVLSVPASFPVYSGSISKVSTDPVTNGPYVVKNWTTGVSMTLVKNPDYTQSKPYPDSVVFDFNVNPSVGILRVENGQADLVGDGIPSANYLQLTANPQTKSDITAGYEPAVILLALNTQVKPFNNPLVRQAIEYAINKQHLVQLLNGRGKVADSILPKSLSGFGSDTYDPYPYNVAKAKQLLQQAGYAIGFSTELGLASEQTGSSEISSEIQADLKAIGINLTVKPLPQDASAIAKVPMMTYSWNMDYPDPSDFIGGFVTSPAVVGGSNPAFLNDPQLVQMAQKADQMPLDPARVSAYEAIDKRAMEDAAYVPLFYPELTYFHSKKVQAFTKPSVYFPAEYNTLWLSH